MSDSDIEQRIENLEKKILDGKVPNNVRQIARRF